MLYRLVPYIGLVTLIFLITGVSAQTNLIRNGDFETFSACPTQLSNVTQQLPLATGWVVPTSGTPDYFNSCSGSSNPVAIPINTYGFQSTHGGNGYVGIYAFTNPATPLENTREYIQSKLIQPLKAGKVYYFKMYVSLANAQFFRKSVQNIGAYFSVGQISRVDNGPFTYTPQVVSSTFLTDTSGWTEISGSFIAAGNEEYVTIGRFGVDNTSTTKELLGDATTNNSYYYIDDISLIDSCYQYDPLSVILGPDSAYNCVAQPINIPLKAQNALTSSYIWSTGATTSNINITTAGTYWVKMSEGRCVIIDTLKILGKMRPIFSLGNDTAPCFNSTLTLAPTIYSASVPYTYRWMKSVENTVFELSNNTSFHINYPDEIILELSANGCSNKDTITIHSTTLSRVRLPPDSAICRNTLFSLNGQTNGALYYQWNTGSTTPVIQTLKNFDRYILTAMDSFCLSSDTISFSIKGPANFLRDTTVCGAQTLVFSGDPASTSFLWSTGATSQQYAVTSGGTYSLIQQKDGCTVWDSMTVVMDSIPFSDLGNDRMICVDPTYELHANAPLAQSYLWDTGDTTESIVFQKSGKYAVTTTNKNCVYRDSVLIQTQINTPFSFGPDQYDCFSEPIILSPKSKRTDKFLWNDGSTEHSYTVTKPGTYWLRIISGVCTNYDTISFFPKYVPSVELGNDTSLCLGHTLQLDAQDSGDFYLWNTGADSRIIEVSKTGYYYVEKRTVEGCYIADSINVVFVKGFVLLKSTEALLCADSSVEIKPTQNLKSYLWSDGSTQAYLKVTRAGTYWIEATDTNGCLVSDTIEIIAIQKPTPELDSTIFTCEFPLTLETSPSFASYLWSNGETLPNTDVYKFGSYSVTVTDTLGCKGSALVQVKSDCPTGVRMSNVFTPNQDGFNDIIIPQYQHIIRTQFEIRNRWGAKVFETQRMEEGWNGVLSNGTEAPAGVYFYTIECTGIDDAPYSLQGTITLIR